MDWSPDCCLGCDREFTPSGNGAYCSQSCRLADLEKSNKSPSASPHSAVSPSSWQSTSTAPLPNPSSNFHLPPPVNFAAYSLTPSSYAPISQSPPTGPYGHAYSQSYSQPSSTHSTLYSSPSQVSLSSQGGAPAQDPSVLADNVKNELQGYAASFDSLRDWKRRLTVA